MGFFTPGSLPERFKHFKQVSPSNQAIITIGALKGHISNIEEGIKPNTEDINRLIEDLEFLCETFMQEYKGW